MSPNEYEQGRVIEILLENPELLKEKVERVRGSLIIKDPVELLAEAIIQSSNARARARII